MLLHCCTLPHSVVSQGFEEWTNTSPLQWKCLNRLHLATEGGKVVCGRINPPWQLCCRSTAQQCCFLLFFSLLHQCLSVEVEKGFLGYFPLWTKVENYWFAKYQQSSVTVLCSLKWGWGPLLEGFPDVTHIGSRTSQANPSRTEAGRHNQVQVTATAGTPQ